MNLCERIDFNLAKLLNNRIYADIYDDKYAAEEVTVTWDNYLGTKKLEMESMFMVNIIMHLLMQK